MVRELKSHVGPTFELFGENNKSKEPTAESACCSSVGRHRSKRVDEGRKSWIFLAIKKVHTVVGKGEKGMLRDHGIDLQLGREKEKKKVRRYQKGRATKT